MTIENSRADALTYNQSYEDWFHDALSKGLVSAGSDKDMQRAWQAAILAASPVEQPAEAPKLAEKQRHAVDEAAKVLRDNWEHGTAEDLLMAFLPESSDPQPTVKPIEKCAGCHARCTNNPPDCYAAPSPADERAAFVKLMGYDRPETEGVAVDVWDSQRATWLEALAFSRAASANETGAEACKTCGGSRVVDDGEITGSGGVEFENGPIKCVKDCPDCTAPQPAQADARVGLTDEQRVAIQECIDYLRPAAKDFADLDMGDSKHARCIRTLRALLATPQPEPRAEVTGEVIPWGRVLELGDKHGMQWAGKTGWKFESDDPLYAFANDVARYAIAARTGARS